MEDEGIDTQTYNLAIKHTVRSASTSEARTIELSTNQNLNWSNANTFRKFYNREIDTVNGNNVFVNMVLS